MAKILFDPASTEPYRLSRSKLQLFLDCPRCFYLDRRLGAGRPDIPAYTLNNTVDVLLKREFDGYRMNQIVPPILHMYGAECIPWKDPRMDAWRDMRQGIEVLHTTGLLFFGAVDDIWQSTEDGSLSIVDYKATATEKPITLEGEWREGYKRQVEMYQWLLSQHEKNVSSLAYFLFANADRTKDAFDRTLQFGLSVLSHTVDASWVDDALKAAHECLMHDQPPPGVTGCVWCAYRSAAHV